MDLQEISVLLVDTVPDGARTRLDVVEQWSVPDKSFITHHVRGVAAGLADAHGTIYDVVVISLESESPPALEIVTEFVRTSPESAVIVVVPEPSRKWTARAIRAGAQEAFAVAQLLDPDTPDRVGTAIERKRRESLRDGQGHVIELLAKGYPLSTVLAALAKDLERQHQDMICSILLLDQDGKRLLHGAAPSLPESYNRIVHGIEIGPNKGSCGTCAWLGRPIIVADIQQHSFWRDYRAIAREYGLAACWSHPITSSSGKLLGTFAVYFHTPREARAAELRLIERAAAIAGIAITQRQTEIALRYRFDFEKLIFSLSTRFISTSTEQIDVEINRALESIGEFTGVDRSALFLLSPDGMTVDNSHEWHRLEVEAHRDRLQNQPIERFAWFRSRLERQEVVTVKSLEDLPPSAAEELVELRRRDVQSLVTVPIVFGQRVLGFVVLETTREPKVWTADAVTLLKMCAQMFANALERKRFENELIANREEFLRNEARLRLTFDTAHIGMATLGVDGRLLSVNNAFTQLLGYTSVELVQHTLSELSHPDDRRIPRRKLRDLLRGYNAHIDFERQFLHKSGGVVHTVVRLGAVFDSNKRPAYIVAEVEDITEKKNWELEYLKACKLESLGVLAGGIAHDFNNILMAILGSISFTKLEVPPETRMYERLEDVEKAVYRARDLTHQLLTFSKGGVPITRTTSMPDLIRETVGFSLSGTSVSWNLEAPEQLWPVEVDEGQISQVVNNLIINASQAMPDGGRIRVTCANFRIERRASDYGLPLRAGRYVRITFADDGCGIRPEDLPKIFDPFFTTKEGGSGLGLATAYSIIKRHQGHIEVDSRIGTGTTFTITLPASRNAAPKPKREPTRIHTGHGRILLMDDETMVRKTAGYMLRRLGYEVDFAINGNEALELYQKAKSDGRSYAAVIMDLTIPGGMGGKVAIRKLKKLDPSVRAIVSSGYAGGPVMAEYRKYGFSGVMAKPYEISTLSSVLSDVLTESSGERRLLD